MAISSNIMEVQRRPLPMYEQIKQLVLERIRSGEWRPDDQIPSENEMVEKLGISRMTVNRALRELTSEGHLIRVQGVGTFVAKAKPQAALLEIRSIADEIRQRGGVYSCNIHLLREEKASPSLAAETGLKAGAAIYHSVIVHRDGDKAIQLADRFVNPVIAPEYLKQDFTKITPSAYLLQMAPVTEAEHVVEAVLPDKTMQNMLDIEPTEPCLVLYRKTWSGEHLATRSQFTYPGSRFRLGGRFKPPESAFRLAV